MSRPVTLLDKLIVAMDAADDLSTPHRKVEIVLCSGCLIVRVRAHGNGQLDREVERRMSLDMVEDSAWEYCCRDLAEDAVGAL